MFINYQGNNCRKYELPGIEFAQEKRVAELSNQYLESIENKLAIHIMNRGKFNISMLHAEGISCTLLVYNSNKSSYYDKIHRYELMSKSTRINYGKS
jgi:hypothetical protein